MNTEHTPGPWFSRSATAGEFNITAESGGFAPLAKVKGDKRSTLKDAQANARLIAAAPDLLEALKDMLDSHEDACTGYGEGAADKARAAIAKATGGDA